MPSSFATELYETDFEEDSSDLEEYAGRRSEDSVSRRGARVQEDCAK